MTLHTHRVERAADALLSPRHYEFLLFLQGEISRQCPLPEAPRKDICQAVLKIIRAEKAGEGLHSIEDADDVLKEVMRRLE